MIEMDECIQPNSYVLTISIYMHGAVINVDLNDKENEIFNNVRYYSHSGEYSYSSASVMDDITIYKYLINTFRKTLYEPTFVEMENLEEKFKPIYTSRLKKRGVYDEKQHEMSCKLHNVVVYDKFFSKFEYLGDRIDQLYCYFNPNVAFQGIRLVSLHKNMSNAVDGIKYQLVTSDNFDLSSVSGLVKLSVLINGKDIVSQVIQETLRTQKNEEDIIVKSDNINLVKMSYFVQLIKKIFNNNCSINLIDFSCSHIYDPKHITKQEADTAMSYTKSDIEAPHSSKDMFGGKKHKQKKIQIKKYKKSKKLKSKKNRTRKNKK